MERVSGVCAGCGVYVAFADDDFFWHGGERVHYSYSWAARYGERHDDEEAAEYADEQMVAAAGITPAPAFAAAWPMIDGKSYCPGCAHRCGGCWESHVFSRGDLDPGDPYAPGASLPDPDDYYSPGICVGCYEGKLADADADDDCDADDADDDCGNAHPDEWEVA